MILSAPTAVMAAATLMVTTTRTVVVMIGTAGRRVIDQSSLCQRLSCRVGGTRHARIQRDFCLCQRGAGAAADPTADQRLNPLRGEKSG